MQIYVVQTAEAVAVVIRRDGQQLALARTPAGVTVSRPESPPVTRPTVAGALLAMRHENMFAGVRP